MCIARSNRLQRASSGRRVRSKAILLSPCCEFQRSVKPRTGSIARVEALNETSTWGECKCNSVSSGISTRNFCTWRKRLVRQGGEELLQRSHFGRAALLVLADVIDRNGTCERLHRFGLCRLCLQWEIQLSDVRSTTKSVPNLIKTKSTRQRKLPCSRRYLVRENGGTHTQRV